MEAGPPVTTLKERWPGLFKESQVRLQKLHSHVNLPKVGGCITLALSSKYHDMGKNPNYHFNFSFAKYQYQLSFHEQRNDVAPVCKLVFKKVHNGPN